LSDDIVTCSTDDAASAAGIDVVRGAVDGQCLFCEIPAVAPQNVEPETACAARGMKYHAGYSCAFFLAAPVARDQAAAACERRGGHLFQYDEAVLALEVLASPSSSSSETTASPDYVTTFRSSATVENGLADFLTKDCNDAADCWLAKSGSGVGDGDDDECLFYGTNELNVHDASDSECGELKSVVCQYAIPIGRTPASGFWESTTTTAAESGSVSYPGYCPFGADCPAGSVCDFDSGVCVASSASFDAAPTDSVLSASQFCEAGTSCALAGQTCSAAGVCVEENDDDDVDADEDDLDIASLWTIQAEDKPNRTAVYDSAGAGYISDGYDAYPKLFTEGVDEATGDTLVDPAPLTYVARELSFHVDVRSFSAAPVEGSNTYAYLTLQFLDLDLHDADSACAADTYSYFSTTTNDAGFPVAYEKVAAEEVPDDYVTVLYTMPAAGSPEGAAADNALGRSPTIVPCVDVEACADVNCEDPDGATRCKATCGLQCLAVNTTALALASSEFPQVHTPPGVLDATVVMTVHQCNAATYTGWVNGGSVPPSVADLTFTSAVVTHKRGFAASFSVAYGSLDTTAFVTGDVWRRGLLDSAMYSSPADGLPARHLDSTVVPTPCGKDLTVATEFNGDSALSTQVLAFAGQQPSNASCAFTVSAPDDASSLLFRFVGDPGCSDTAGFPDLGTELASHPCSFWAEQDTWCRDMLAADLSILGYTASDRDQIRLQCPFSCGECAELPGGVMIASVGAAAGEAALVHVPAAANPRTHRDKRSQHRLHFPVEGSLSYSTNGFAVPTEPLEAAPQTVATWLRFETEAYADSEGNLPSENVTAIVMDATGCDESSMLFGVKVSSGNPVIILNGHDYRCDADVGTGEWYHVAFVISADLAVDEVAVCYINGVLAPASKFANSCGVVSALSYPPECVEDLLTDGEPCDIFATFPSRTSAAESSYDTCSFCDMEWLNSVESYCDSSSADFSGTSSFLYGGFTIDSLYERYYRRSETAAHASCKHRLMFGAAGDTTKARHRQDAQPFYGSLENFVVSKDAQDSDAIAQMVRTGDCDHMSGVLLCLQGGDGGGTVAEGMYWADSSPYLNHARLAGVTWEESSSFVTVGKDANATAVMTSVFASSSHGIHVTADTFGAFTLEVWAASCPSGGCGSHGRCVRGMCMCDVGFEGVSCESRMYGAFCTSFTGGAETSDDSVVGERALVTDFVGERLPLFGMASDSALERRRRVVAPQDVFAADGAEYTSGGAPFECSLYFRSPEHSSVEVSGVTAVSAASAGAVSFGVFDVANPGLVAASSTSLDGGTQSGTAQMGEVQDTLDATLETVPGFPTFDFELHPNSAATFDGVSDRAFLREVEIEGNGDLTFDFWMKVPAVVSGDLDNDMFEVLSYASRTEGEDDDGITCQDSTDYTVDLRKLGLLGDAWKVSLKP
jgi:hypothetical protein